MMKFSRIQKFQCDDLCGYQLHTYVHIALVISRKHALTTMTKFKVTLSCFVLINLKMLCHVLQGSFYEIAFHANPVAKNTYTI